MKTKSEERLIQDSHSMAPLIVAAGSKFLLEGLGASAFGAAIVTSPVLVTTLLAAGAFHIGKLFWGDDNDSNSGKILESLQRTSLDVHIGKDGKMSSTVNTAAETSTSVKDDHQVVVENHNGTMIVHINNLTINLNAELVQQLNMNPKEVINQLTDKIRQTSLKAIAEDKK